MVAGSCVGQIVSLSEEGRGKSEEGEGVGIRRIGKSLRDVENGIQFAYFLTALLQLLVVTKDKT